MSLFQSEEITNATEELIVTGMLHNLPFLAFTNSSIDISHFENDDCSVLAEIALEFYEDNKKAPGIHSVELLESVSDLLSDQASNIEKLLHKMDEKYGGRDIHTNVLITTYKGWIRDRSMRLASKEMDRLLKLGRVSEAELKMEEVRVHLKTHLDSKPLTTDIFDPNIVHMMEHTDEIIMKFHNDLDRFLPPQTKNRFYTYLGGKKTAKSQWLEYKVITGLENDLNVLAITFELTEDEYLHRLWCGISGCRVDLNPNNRMKSTEIEEELPVFDCEKNRKRTCERPECPDQELFDFEEYESGVWEVCTECQGQREFDPVVWKEDALIEVIRTPKMFKEEQKKWRMQYKGSVKVMAFEPGTMSVEDLIAQIESLQLIEGFIPDLITIDSADNMLAQTRYSEKRHELGSIWLHLSALAKRGYLVWTVTQTNRSGWGVEWLTDAMIGEDASKLMVVDGMVSINEHVDRSAGVNEKYWQTQRLRAHDYRSAKLPHYDVRILNDFGRYLACIETCRM